MPDPKTTKAAPKAEKPAPDSSLIPAMEGGDPMPERREPVQFPTDAEVNDLATVLAQSQGIRFPTTGQLGMGMAVSYITMAEMILVARTALDQ